MTNVYVLDRDFNLLGIVDDFISVIWRPAHCDIGDFEIYTNATEKAVALLAKNNYVVRDNDITVDEEGNTTYKKVMIIKNITITTDVEEGDHLLVTGRELKYILNQRVVWYRTELTGTAEDGIRKLVTENAINCLDSWRNIPRLTMEPESGNKNSILEKQLLGNYLDQAVVDICNAFEMGWDIYIKNDMMVMRIYRGVNRSYNQSQVPVVLFSEEFENLGNTEYQLNTEKFANVARIAGEGEGEDRVFANYPSPDLIKGLERYETFVDAKDLSRNKGNGEKIEFSTYISQLHQQGKETLSAMGYTEGFVGEILQSGPYVYEQDFGLGDTVTVVNKYGISRDVKVLSAIESEDGKGIKLIPQFNI